MQTPDDPPTVETTADDIHWTDFPPPCYCDLPDQELDEGRITREQARRECPRHGGDEPCR